MSPRSVIQSSRIGAVLCILLSLCTPLRATHYLGFSLAAHFPLTLDLMDNTRNQPALGGEAGLVYEWHYSHLMIHTGLHFALQDPTVALDRQTIVQPMVDTRGMHFDYHGSLRGRIDQLLFTQIAVPLMVGATWNGLYGLIGPKLVMPLSAQAVIKAELQTEGDYLGRYYDWFVEMPNHGYHDYEPVKDRHRLTLNPLDLRLAAEVGYMGKVGTDARTQIGTLVRIGLFLEYGLFNMRGKPVAEASTIPAFDQYMYVRMTHPYAVEETATSPVHFLSFGLRLSVLFPLVSDPSSHRKCNCYGNF